MFILFNLLIITTRNISAFRGAFLTGKQISLPQLAKSCKSRSEFTVSLIGSIQIIYITKLCLHLCSLTDYNIKGGDSHKYKMIFSLPILALPNDSPTVTPTDGFSGIFRQHPYKSYTMTHSNQAFTAANGVVTCSAGTVRNITAADCEGNPVAAPDVYSLDFYGESICLVDQSGELFCGTIGDDGNFSVGKLEVKYGNDEINVIDVRLSQDETYPFMCVKDTKTDVYCKHLDPEPKATWILLKGLQGKQIDTIQAKDNKIFAHSATQNQWMSIKFDKIINQDVGSQYAAVESAPQ
eukprot:NODE_122_length_17689_cov_1.046219.p5 type:complete len:295 gc:universal NODE_122_length_17689_cov_1.046219:14995-15879(+)